jgi:hypothetical protein
MPYFYRTGNNNSDKNINLLFVHIPKTGGTSLEYYLSDLYDIPLNFYSLHNLKVQDGDFSSPQHYTLRTIWNRRKEIRLIEENLRIITLVRNPYSRMVSELFFQKIIDSSTSSDEITKCIYQYLNNQTTTYDNHRLPQVEFLLDESGKIWKNVEILHMEHIKHELAQHGFHNFHHHNNSATKMRLTKFLNDESYKLINDYYSQDFAAFGYTMIHKATHNTTSHIHSTNLSRLLRSTATTYYNDNYSELAYIFLCCFIVLISLLFVLLFKK